MGSKITVMSLLKHLDRSNCRKCGVPTCMAFSALVVRGEKNIKDCPQLDPKVLDQIARQLEEAFLNRQAHFEEAIEKRKLALKDVDFTTRAHPLGCVMKGKNIEVRSLGKRFELDPEGHLFSECHVNLWVHLPILHYVAYGKGLDLEGQWLPFRDLPYSEDWVRFFEHRCEREIRKIADMDTELFLDTLDLFSGLPIDKGTRNIYSTADHVMMLHPLPKVPLLVAYWAAEEDFESKLTLFFDRTASENIGAEAIFRLCTGIVEMLRKIMARHGYSLTSKELHEGLV